MKNEISSAVVLAGGDSRRMGKDKNLISINGKNMIELVIDSIYEQFDEIVIVTDKPAKFQFFEDCDKIEIIQDKMSHLEKSSLRGIYAGLGEINNKYGFVFAGDMPFINPELVKAMISQLYNQTDKLQNWEIVIPKIQGYHEPLFALYNFNCRWSMEKYLLKQQNKILNILNNCRVLELSEEFCRAFDQELTSFFNVNTLEQLQKAREYHRQQNT